MKAKLIFLIIFFIIVQTSGFWIEESGVYTMPIFLILTSCFAILCFITIIEIIGLIYNSFKSRQQNLITLTFVVLLSFSYIFPFGIMRRENEGEKNILFQASHEGTANCKTNFFLKENNKFTQKSVCFGIIKIMGRYKINKDTIHFSNLEFPSRGAKEKYYQFAILTNPDSITSNEGLLYFYKHKADTTPKRLFVNYNQVIKLHTTQK